MRQFTHFFALILWFFGPMQAVAAMAAFFFVLDGSGWSYGEVLAPTDPVYLQATTACPVAIVVMQIVNVLICSTPTLSLLALGPFSNRLILAGIAAEVAIILLIVYTHPGSALFRDHVAPGDAVGATVPFSLAMLAMEEGRKWLVRHRSIR